VKNILINEEINVNTIVEILHAFSGTNGNHASIRKDNIKRTFERLIFLHAEADRKVSVDYLNRTFAMEKTGERYYVLMLSSLEFLVKTSRASSFERKVLNESISEYLTAFPQTDLSIPFAFYIEDAFYVVLICKGEETPVRERIQVDAVLRTLGEYSRPAIGSNLVLLCSTAKTDFKDIDRSIKELDRLRTSVHLGNYPYLASKATARIIDANEVNFNRAVDLALSLLKDVEKGEDYVERAQKLFSHDSMKGISFDQFMKLKEFLRFEFELIRTKRQDAMEAAKEFDLALAELTLKTNVEHTLATVLTIARSIVASSQKTYNYLITKCVKFIAANYSTNIGLYDAAKKLNISTVYLSQLFKKETGMNFNAYVNEYRLNRAKALIDEGVYKINQISEMVGYNNTQYFSNCFKKKFQMTPIEFKNRSVK